MPLNLSEPYVIAWWWAHRTYISVSHDGDSVLPAEDGSLKITDLPMFSMVSIKGRGGQHISTNAVCREDHMGMKRGLSIMLILSLCQWYFNHLGTMICQIRLVPSCALRCPWSGQWAAHPYILIMTWGWCVKWWSCSNSKYTKPKSTVWNNGRCNCHFTHQ
jgi:hypothetical protein